MPRARVRSVPTRDTSVHDDVDAVFVQQLGEEARAATGVEHALPRLEAVEDDTAGASSRPAFGNVRPVVVVVVPEIHLQSV